MATINIIRTNYASEYECEWTLVDEGGREWTVHYGIPADLRGTHEALGGRGIAPTAWFEDPAEWREAFGGDLDAREDAVDAARRDLRAAWDAHVASLA
jgi:hypothetical protein